MITSFLLFFVREQSTISEYHSAGENTYKQRNFFASLSDRTMFFVLFVVRTVENSRKLNVINFS